MRDLRAVLMVILTATSISAQPTTQRTSHVDLPSWAWSIEERIARRTDPQTIDSLRVNRGSHERLDAPAFQFRLEGTTRPELFLPTELLRNLLSGLADPEGRALLRLAYEPTVARLQLPPDLIEHVVVIADDYLRRDARIQELNIRIGVTPSQSRTLRYERDSLGIAQCLAVFNVLHAARTRFGASRFDRFLYEAVAPGMFIAWSGLDDPAELASRERGCQ